MRITIFIFLCSLLSFSISAQSGKHPTKSKAESRIYQRGEISKLQNPYKTSNRKTTKQSHAFRTLSPLQAPRFETPNLTFIRDTKTELPIFVKGTIGALEKGNNSIDRCFSFLEVLQPDMQIEKARQEFVHIRTETDALGTSHIRMQQQYKGIPVYGGEIILHEKQNHVRSMNGRYFPSPSIENTEPQVDESFALDFAKLAVEAYTTVATIPTDQQFLVGGTQAELVIYHHNQDIDAEKLAWHIRFHPNIREQWTCFIDAQSGEVLSAHRSSCSFTCTHHLHGDATVSPTSVASDVSEMTSTSAVVGPVTANATDLFGINRNINVYEHQGTYYMIDAARPMFNSSASNFPDEPVGAIWTINANNTSPQNQFNFNTTHVTSSNNNWNNPTAVSAHYNGGLAYEYFRTTFNRNSINGSGGNIVSIINVSDESGNSMDNAFWNGAAMFYGNGGQAFDPLAKALDVAGHEMSHGVIQRTANLEYVGQSGALNESFADIFGAMIDRNDWRMGEDVVNSQFFPSGALRDLSNPNNGGNSLNDRGWQPAHMNEFQNLPNTPQGDFGGVHINSGIPNKAYYNLATSIGKSNAEQIYYRALANYLTKSSQFIDCRIAVVQAATDLFGNGSNEVAEAHNAFTAVGIGSGSATTNQEEVEENPGTEFILSSNESLSRIFVLNSDGTNPQVISETSLRSKPSITDDGSFIVFIGTDQRMYRIFIDWETGDVDQGLLSNEAIWRNVAVSKDGQRVAALTEDRTNRILVYDFGVNDWYYDVNGEWGFELYNPTYTQGVSTGDVQYADVLEWDFSGEYVMYDAYNEIQSSFGQDISYWDIGFMQVWNNNANFWANDEGNISKLFSGLPENTSIGNPTFSKNSDFIVAFDFIDENGNNQLMAVNVETGETSEQPIFTNGILNYPNYSVDDTQLIFDAQNQGGGQVIGITDIQSDKLNAASGQANVFIEGGKWATWFATGQRELVDVETVEATAWGMEVFPNPTADILQITASALIDNNIEISLVDMLGNTIWQEQHTATQGQWKHQISLSDIPAGTYLLQLQAANQLVVEKVSKL